MTKRRINSHILPCCGVDGRERIPVIIYLPFAGTREDTANVGVALIKDWYYQDGGTQEELTISCCEGWVVGEFPC